jgi:hypothetical protein
MLAMIHFCTGDSDVARLSRVGAQGLLRHCITLITQVATLYIFIHDDRVCCTFMASTYCNRSTHKCESYFEKLTIVLLITYD